MVLKRFLVLHVERGDESQGDVTHVRLYAQRDTRMEADAVVAEADLPGFYLVVERRSETTKQAAVVTTCHEEG